MSEIFEKAASEIVTTVLTFVVTVAVPYALVLVRAWLKAKTAAIEDAKLREGVEWAIARLDATAETVVREIEQTVKSWNKETGKVITPDALLTTAMSRTWKRLPPHAAESLKKMFPDSELRQVIRGKIESKVKAKPCY